MKLTLFAVRHGNKIYEFREPLEIDIKSRYYLSCKYFNIIDAAPTLDELWGSFASWINFIWIHYAICNEPMTHSAIDLKEKLLNLITVRKII